MDKPWSIFIGFEPRQAAGFAVAKQSIREKLTQPVPIQGLVLSHLSEKGYYRRPTEWRRDQLWDTISDAPMATEFAISRFLVPEVVKLMPHNGQRGWALFLDCDMLARVNLCDLFRQIEREHAGKALVCVKHEHIPRSNVKMDNQIQTNYPRKNWSSFMAFNCDHPGNELLSIELVNRLPGRDLHAFCWLKENDIGGIGAEWNYLVGHSHLPAGVEPKVVHYTEGSPCLPAFQDVEFADEWRGTLARWAAWA